MFPTHYDFSSVQPTVAASDGTSNQRDVREEPCTYLGVQKVNAKPIYIAQVRDNDATKGPRSIYLGKFDKEVNAARAHDLVALKLWGSSAKTNFPESQYKQALEAMTDMTEKEVVDTTRMLSFNFVKSISMYRGVTRDLSTAKWEASFGMSSDENKSLGLFDTEEEAARAYDVESIRLKGYKAITNINMRFYNVVAIMEGETDNAKVIFGPQGTIPLEATQPSEVLQNIIGQGSSNMLYDTGAGNVNSVGVHEFQRPMIIPENYTEQEANYMYLASQSQGGNDQTRNLSSVIEGQSLVYRSGDEDEYGQGSSANMCFLDELTNAYKPFLKRS